MYITQTHQERLGHLAAAWWKQSGRSLEAAAVRFPTHQFLQQYWLNAVRDRTRQFTERAHAETPPPRRGLQRSVRPLSSHLGEKAGRPAPQVQKSPSPS